MKTTLTPSRRALAPLALAALLSGCSLMPGPAASTRQAAMTRAIGAGDKVVMLPVSNYTDVPQAGLRVEALLEPALRAQGLRQLVVYPPGMSTESLFEPGERKAQAEAEKWAKAQGMRWAVSGAVNEWRYKTGLDGEPAVGMMIQVTDLTSGEVVYSAAGGRTGGARQALAAVGQQLAAELAAGIRVAPAGAAPGGR